MVELTKHNEVIHSVDEWFRLAPPKQGAKHWKDGRSAKELARAWFPQPGEPVIPDELARLFESHESTSGVTWKRAEPERLIQFDKCGGEPRNADLALWGHKDEELVYASVEAKSDESFGGISGEYVNACAKGNQNSRVPERFALLCRGIFGIGPEDVRARSCQYQLLTAVAGALCDAEMARAETVAFVVHEFTGVTDETKVNANRAALDHFVRIVSNGAIDSVSEGQLLGPLFVPGNEFFCGTASLYIGKCRRVVTLL